MIYAYECQNGHYFERALPLADYAVAQICDCGSPGIKVIQPVRGFVQRDVVYDSPIDGRPITSMRSRRDDLARSGCVEYDPEMKKDVDRRIEREQVELERRVESTVEAAMEQMPSHKRERLENELKGGADVVPDRQVAPFKSITKVNHGH